MPLPGFLDAVLGEASAAGQSLSAWGVAWARVLPSALVVPAFGLGFLPVSLRAAVGLALAVSIAPASAPASAALPHAAGVPWPLLLASEALRGIPVALVAATSLWAATVAGGVAETSFGLRLRASALPLGRDAGPFGTLLGLLSAGLFLDAGGAARISEALVTLPPPGAGPLVLAAHDLAVGIGVGASLGAPLLAVALVVDVAFGLAARELGTLRLEVTLAPVRALAVLVATAVLFDRLAEALASLGR